MIKNVVLLCDSTLGHDYRRLHSLEFRVSTSLQKFQRSTHVLYQKRVLQCQNHQYCGPRDCQGMNKRMKGGYTMVQYCWNRWNIVKVDETGPHCICWCHKVAWEPWVGPTLGSSPTEKNAWRCVQSQASKPWHWWGLMATEVSRPSTTACWRKGTQCCESLASHGNAHRCGESRWIV